MVAGGLFSYNIFLVFIFIYIYGLFRRVGDFVPAIEILKKVEPSSVWFHRLEFLKVD